MALPNINVGEVGAGYSYTEAFADEFTGTGPGPGVHWMFDTMDDALNRTGNGGQDASGNASSGSVNGKRWSAWANGPNTELVYRDNDQLYIGGKVENVADPTRENYTHEGVAYNWGNIKAYAPYMVQWHRKYDNDIGGHITDPASPNIYMGPGHYIEIKLSVEQMRTPGFRVSLWLTPIIPNESLAYDDNAANGVEIDILEIENWANGGYGKNRVQSKVLGGDAGKTLDQGGGNIDAVGFNIAEGFHTYGLLWLSTGLYWYLDGQEIIRDVDHVPQVNQFLSLTRELNAGVKDVSEATGTDIPSNGVKRPVDVGLYNVSAYPYLDDIGDDKAVVDYIRVWSVNGEGGTFNGPNNTDGDTGGATDGGGTITTTASRKAPFIEYAPDMANGQIHSATAVLPVKADGTASSPDEYTFSWAAGSGVTLVGPTDQHKVEYTMDNIADGTNEARQLYLNYQLIGVDEETIPKITSITVSGGYRIKD